MRSIVFRGKRVDNGEWVEGVPIVTPRSGVWMVGVVDKASGGRGGVVLKEKIIEHEVDPATVGQFSGCYDRNKRRVFDGDLLSDGKRRYLVVWSDTLCEFYAKGDGDGEIWSLYHLCTGHNENRSIEVIGSVYDQPEAGR